MDTPSKNGYVEEDVMKDRVDHLIEHRIPWLLIGLFGGLLTAVVVANYEEILSADMRLAFFIPIIVYLSDAVGTQTETIYVRALANKKRIHFVRYILKESAVGAGLGLISAVLLAFFALCWLKSSSIAITIGLTMFINLTLAPILAVLIPKILHKRHTDPALGAGPVATILQDMISLLVYFFIASIFIF